MESPSASFLLSVISPIELPGPLVVLCQRMRLPFEMALPVSLVILGPGYPPGFEDEVGLLHASGTILLAASAEGDSRAAAKHEPAMAMKMRFMGVFGAAPRLLAIGRTAAAGVTARTGSRNP